MSYSWKSFELKSIVGRGNRIGKVLGWKQALTKGTERRQVSPELSEQRDNSGAQVRDARTVQIMWGLWSRYST